MLIQNIIILINSSVFIRALIHYRQRQGNFVTLTFMCFLHRLLTLMFGI